MSKRKRLIIGTLVLLLLVTGVYGWSWFQNIFPTDEHCVALGGIQTMGIQQDEQYCPICAEQNKHFQSVLNELCPACIACQELVNNGGFITDCPTYDECEKCKENNKQPIQESFYQLITSCEKECPSSGCPKGYIDFGQLPYAMANNCCVPIPFSSTHN